MITTQVRPEAAQVHLKRVEPEHLDAFQERIKMILKPTPNFTRSDAVWGCRVGAHCILDAREVRELTNR